MTPVVLTEALPVTAADGFTGRNNARDLRKGLFASLFLPQAGAPNPLACRPGVLSHDYDTAGVKSLRVDQTATASANVTVNAGAFVCERTGQGPYVGYLELGAGVTVTPGTSDATNPRIDVVYAQVLDKASISTDASTDAIVNVVTGVASSTPVAPTVTADGAVILAQLLRPAGSTTITTANITDKRKSTGLVGSVRRLLPGDTLSDAGKVDGELRYRQAVGALPSLIDYWDAAQSKWRGTQGFTLSQVFPGTPDSNHNVSGWSWSGAAIVTLNVPDPGWPFRVATSAYICAQPSIPGSGPGGTCNVYISVNSGPFSSFILYSDDCTQTATSYKQMQLTPAGADVFTGAATVRVIGDGLGTVDGLHWIANVANLLTCRVNPA